MIELKVVNEVNGREFKAKLPSKSESDIYLDKQISKQNWGENERYLDESEITEALRSRIISTVEILEVKAVDYKAAVEAVEASEGVEAVVAQPEIQAVEYVPYSLTHLVKADYVITEEDLSQSIDYRNEQQIKSRKSEYKSIEEVIHIILDKGMDSQEFIDLQSERQAIKAKYPKE